ncbi:exodeoxyribonuclease V subunit alpha [Shewanella sp. Isolate11]|uniref:exodeoxyribonuclease V subunit alpha n=1 Tax=Shewanella sp. Isolate11 TaxID=2908530 RepID=UPI001EFC3405|nr:exodeoxyribonuclease V subunit alpha [Shewanella sp. Isolate11]MCG9696530.1 exodeoxyribonuclease V subunit alpha [Shewanella sp. Isolate11]
MSQLLSPMTLQQPIEQLLKEWQASRLITPLDRHFALQMASLHKEHASDKLDSNEPLLTLICTLLSRQLSTQHTCLPLEQIDFSNPLKEQQPQCQINLSLPALVEKLANAEAVGLAPQQLDKPLILDGTRLYLQRYYQFESKVADKLLQLAKPLPIENIALAAQRLTCLFPINQGQEYDWQKIATATALTQKLAVITGGPGTGKTTTVTKLLLLLCIQQQDNPTNKSALNIRLVAPTGKAAARLSESIKASKARLSDELKAYRDIIDIDLLAHVPEEAATLHRLLGVLPNTHQFRHHSENPLRLDLLVVDEASMVDLPMMYKLLYALPKHARLILLGDQDQLASVEAGAVLGDICGGLKQTDQSWRMRYTPAKAELLSQLTQTSLYEFIDPSINADNSHSDINSGLDSHPQNSTHIKNSLGDSLVMLMHSHRFKGDAGIGLLASAVNHSDTQGIQQVWQQGYQELHWITHKLHQQGNLGLDELLAYSVAQYQVYLDELLKGQLTAVEIIERFNQYRILCAMRAGEYGVDGINSAMTSALATAKLINPHGEFYSGRPVIIQNNDYNLGLFNGDIGVILPDETHQQRLMACFVQADGSLLKVLPARLPQHDTCYAMTVHKSQGSEFANVSLVMPTKPSVAQRQLLTKELVYTAITRAKLHFTCLGNEAIFEQACKQATQRASGLAKRLWS